MRECWKNQKLFDQHTEQLFVCGEEAESKEIAVKEQDGGKGAELLCNGSSTLIGLAGTTVQWYYEAYPDYKPTLILDSSVSLNPLVEELQGVVQVKDHGALLWVPSSELKHSPEFYCLVVKGSKCLSLQTFNLQDNSDVRDIFASQGDTVVLNCPSLHKNQQWETPLGQISRTTTDGSVKSDQMHISGGDESESYSLVIPAVSDNYSGEYLCFAPFLEVQYSLVLCPKKEPQRIVAFEGRDVSLECDVGQDEFQTVQWYRTGTSGEGGTEFLEGDYQDGNDEEEDVEEDNYYLHSRHRCIFKQETILNKKEEDRGLTLEPSDFKSNPTPKSPAASNVTAYAVGGGLAALLVAGLIAAVVVIKKRAKAQPKKTGSAPGSGLNTNKDIKLNVDPGCTERLTPSDEHDA
ncbi:hypothetical protein LDENG_00087470 [Lucifuga dentata]|nr:hypothetical protein LDENG_00087470 [Lucifuga dentata]